MHTYLRRALPTTRLAAGLALATAGALLSGSGHLLPGAVLLAVAGATAAVHLHRPRRVQPPGPDRAAPGPVLPTQRRAPQTPRPGSGHQPALGTGVVHPRGAGPAGPAPVPPGVPEPTDLRVLPHGALPRQRRPSAGS